MSTAVKKLTLTKVAVGFIAVAMITGMLFAVATPRAQAQTLSELVELFIALDIIPADKASEARAVLQNQSGGGGGGMMGLDCPATPFTANMGQGASSQQAMDLQRFLNSVDGVTVASSGPGSPGMETQYYGPLTASAVSQFQMKYASEVLTPLGLSSGTGYWGPSSRAKANALCAGGGDMPDNGDVPPPPPPGPGAPDDDDEDMDEDEDEDEDEEELSDSEASLEDYDKSSEPDDVDTEEGDEEVQVFGFEFDVEDGDVSVRRVDVSFEAIANGDNNTCTNDICEDEPWRVFEEVQLFHDGDVIASEEADDEDNWTDEGSDVYSIRFSGLDVIFRDGDTAEFVVGVSVGDLDDSDLDQTWNVWVAADDLRAIDGAGIDQYVGSDAAADKGEFDIEAAGADTEMKLSDASSNPDASTIQVSDTNTTDNVPVLVFDIEAEDGQIVINEVLISATTATATLASVIHDVVLEIDGNQYDDWDWDDDCLGSANGTGDAKGTSSCIFFDLDANDDEHTIDADDEVEARVLVDFKQTAGNYSNGQTIEFDISDVHTDDWSVEDVSGDELADGSKSGTGNGEEHTLRATGIFAEFVSQSTDTTVDQNGNVTKGTFTLKFDVTAFDEDAWIPRTASTTASTTAGVSFEVEESNGSTTDDNGTTTVSITSTANASNNRFQVEDGETETFTLKVTYDAAAGDFYNVQLTRIRFGPLSTTALGSLQSYTPAPDEDFETDQVDIDA